MLAIIEELLARDLVVLDRVDTDVFEDDALALGVTSKVKRTANWLGPLKNGPRTLSSPMVFWACRYSDFWMTGGLPAGCSPLTSMGTMSGAYIAGITPKFSPWSRHSTAVLSSTM
ncbi:MAG: hypothetical protein ABI604_05245 [Nitrospirota bacterium]